MHVCGGENWRQEIDHSVAEIRLTDRPWNDGNYQLSTLNSSALLRVGDMYV